MGDVLRKLNRSRWRDSLIMSPLLVAAWWFLGWLLTLSFFDKHLHTLMLLSIKADALTYAGLLFAVQIPVFILLLQRMVDFGYLRRLIIPSVIRFREILVSYIILSLLLLFSQRTSYYYFPVIALTLVSLYTIFITVRVMFDPSKLEDKENNFVRKIVGQVFSDVPGRRKKSSDFFEELRKLDNVTHTLLDIGLGHENMTPLSIRTKRGGLITDIDIKQLNTRVAQQYVSAPLQETKATDKTTQNATDHQPTPTVILQVRPGATVKAQDILMRLYIPNDLKAPENSFLNTLRDTVHIDTAIADSADKKLDELITDFKQQLRGAIDKDSVVQIQQSLEFYKLLLEGITGFSHTVADTGYTFADARQEFHQFAGDSVSVQISSIADILNDELLHSIQDEKEDTCKELIGFLYGELLSLAHEYDIVRAVFADYSFTFTINRLIFDGSAKMRRSSFRNEILEYLLFRLKEHTGLLLYNYRNADNDATIPEEQLKQWLEMRVNDTRGFLLGTYKKSAGDMFQRVLGIYVEFEEDYRLYDGEKVKDVTHLVRCNLFTIAAYMHSHLGEDAARRASRQLIDVKLGRLTATELTDLLVACVDKDYADKWRVDTYDLVADGQMHSIPDFSNELKNLWVDYMLQLGNFPNSVDAYKPTPIDTTFTFSDGLSNTNDMYLVKHLNALIEQSKPHADELLALVNKFIEARKNWEMQKLVAASLSTDKVTEFHDDLIKGYKEEAIALKVFEPAKKLTYVSKATKDYKMFGWNKVNDKEAFIDDWHSGYIMQGGEHGREIATRENQLIAEQLLGSPNKENTAEGWLAHLQDGTEDEWLVFTIGVSPWFIRQEFNKHIVENTAYDDVRFKKVNQLHIEHIYDKAIPSGLYAVRTSQLGTLNIKPKDNEPVEVSIDAYSDNQALLDGMLIDPPQWLQDMGDRDIQEKFLKTKVRMYIYHVFNYTPDPKAKVFYFSLSDRY